MRASIVLLALFIIPISHAAVLESIESDGSIPWAGGFLTGPSADFTAVFDSEPPEDLRFVFVGSEVVRRTPNTCDSRSCTVVSFPVSAARTDYVYVEDGDRHWYDDRVPIVADVEAPEVTSLLVTIGPPSSLSFEAADQSGAGSYRLLRDGVIVSEADVLQDTIELSDIDPGEEVRFALVLTDAFGNRRTHGFGGRVPSEMISIDTIESTAYYDAEGDGIVYFEVRGDVASAQVVVDDRSYPAVCVDACMSLVRSPGPSATVEVRVTDSFGSTVSLSENVVFLEDTQEPVFERFTTTHSSYDLLTGYTDGTVFVEFEENARMLPEDVIVAIDGRRTTAHSCQRMSGTIVRCSIVMGDAGKIEFRKAYDAAGNRAHVPDAALTERTIAVDTRPPQVEMLAVESDTGSSRADTVHIGEPSEIRIVTRVVAEGSQANRGRVTIRDSDTRIEEVDFVCTMSGDRAQCTSEPIMIYEASSVSIEVFDASGVPYRADRLVTMDGTGRPGESRWTVIDVIPTPGYYMPDGLMPLTLEARIGSELLSSTLSIAGVSLESCNGIEGGFASSDGRTVVITGFSDADRLSAGRGSCTISVTTIRGGMIDPDPQSLEIEFVLAPIASAGIEDPASLYEKSGSAAKLDSALSWAETAFGYASLACDAYEGINLVSLSVNLAAVATGGDVGATPMGVLLAQAGGALFRGVEGIGVVADPLCAVANCQFPIDDDGTTLQDVVLGVYEDLEGGARSSINDVFNDTLGYDVVGSASSVSRVEDSLVLSAITACVPGVISNMREMTQATCARDLCLLRVHTGDYAGTASMCSYSYAMQVCAFVGDEIISVVPWVSIFTDILDQIGGIIRQPLRIVADIGLEMLISAVTDLSPSARADFNRNLAQIINLVNVGTSPSGPVSTTDYCEELSDYLDDLDERGVFE